PSPSSSPSFLTDPATTEIYPLSLHDALPISATSWPMRPNPTTPTVFSSSSTPVSCLRSQRPAFTEESARPRFRSEARISAIASRSEEHTSELQSRENLVCRLLLEKKKKSRDQ